MSPAPPPQPPLPGPYPQQPYGQAPYASQPYPPQPYAPSPYPPMYAQPVMVAPIGPPGANTFDGLKFLKWATLIVMGLAGIGFLAGLLTLVAFATLPTGANLGQIDAAIAGASALGIVSGILGLLAFIFAMVGFYKMHEGRTEFGEAHTQSMKAAVRFFYFTLGAYVAGIVASIVIVTVMVFSAVAAQNFTPGAFVGMAYALVVVGGAIGILTTYLSAMTMQSLVGKLMTAAGRARRQLFILLSLVGAVSELAIGVVVASTFGGLFGNSTLAGQASAAGSLASIVTVITMFLYWKQIESAEAGARAMIASGRFDPDATAGAAAVPPPTVPLRVPPL